MQASTLAAALLCAMTGAARAQISEDGGPPAVEAKAVPKTPASCTDGITVKRPGKFCETLEDCVQFCSCACDFAADKWKKDSSKDASTTCSNIPTGGPGMI